MKYLDLVNVKQGTKSAMRYSNGNTLPLTQRPFGMGAYAPQTNGANHGWWFHPDDRYCEGVRLTHQASPWIADYGSLLFLPQSVGVNESPSRSGSGFRMNETVLRPDYIKLELLRYRCLFELTPAVRGAKLRVNYDGERNRYFSVLSVSGDLGFEVDKENNRVYGYTTCNGCYAAKNFKMHFVLDFGKTSVNFDDVIAEYSDGKREKCLSNSGNMMSLHIGVIDNCAEMSFAFSYLSREQAIINLDRELLGKSFDELREETESVWEGYLSRIEAKDKSIDKLKTFYSCLYRAFTFPNKCYEIDENGNPVHYVPKDGSVGEGVRYTNNGFWDTYHTVYSLYSIIAKDEFKEILDGFVVDYKEIGWLPRWTALGEVGCMPSTLIDAVIADSAVKGISDRETLELALKGMIHHATVESEDKRYGRNGAELFRKYGYVPRELEKETVNLTLDFAYGDYCIAQVAKVLGYYDIYNEYMKSSKYYENIFDPESGFMRGKDVDGKMADHFSPTSWGGEYTEGSAWQTTFAVPHDLEGLAELYGGKENLVKKVDELFSTKPVYEVGAYGGEIHEMTEMAAVDFGQCAISNQPSFSYPYLYSALGLVDKTAYWVEKICNELFTWREDGFPGDEDNGSMGAWYVFSCLGLYPFCPGKAEYVKSKTLLDEVKINGKIFDVDSFDGNIILHSDVEKAIR